MKACVEYRITRLNAAALINFLALPILQLLEGGIYLKITFLKSLTTITINRPFAPKYCARTEKSLILQCIGFYMR